MAKKSARPVRDPVILKLAEDIAADLFTNGSGDKADRLVSMQEPSGGTPRNLGGWCEAAVRDRVYDLIQRHKPTSA